MRVLKFSASWCNPCKNLQKSLQENEDVLKYKVEDIDIDESLEETKKYGIRAVPTIVLLDDDNNEIDRSTNIKTAKQLREWTDNNEQA
jgi:thioredoxin 1